MRTTLSTAVTATALAAVTLGAAALAPTASAHGRDGVRAAGSCSAGAHWTVKAKHDSGRIEVEGEIDSNRAGQAWRWSIGDNGHRAALGPARTAGASGSFSVTRHVANQPGTDRIVFRANRPATGQTCQGVVRI